MSRMSYFKSKEDLVDPNLILPSEMFCHLLSFLPPSSIASTSAVSRPWRFVVHSNPILHNEIDLIDLKADFNSSEILWHLNRLSLPLLRKINRLFPEGFTRFSYNYVDEDDDDYEQMGEEEGIMELLSASIETLQSLDLRHVNVPGKEKWDLWMKCTNLFSLSLDLKPLSAGGDRSRLEVPNSNNKKPLKHLDLQVEDYELYCVQFYKWIGDALEELKFCLEGDLEGPGLISASDSALFSSKFSKKP